MRFSQITGDDQPQPGRSVFQTTFSVVLHCSGSVSPSANPSAFAPRNWGQFVVSARRTEAKLEATSNKKATCRMVVLLLGWHSEARTPGSLRPRRCAGDTPSGTESGEPRSAAPGWRGPA